MPRLHYLALLSLFTAVATAGTESTVTSSSSDSTCCEWNWRTGAGVSIGRWLFPSFSFNSAFGASTGNEASLAVGHHDPNREGFTIQSIDFSLTAKLGSNLTAFAGYAATIDLDDHWADEFEEYYLRAYGLPGDISLRGGRFYPRVGFGNHLHPHDYRLVDQQLLNGRMLGEDSLVLNGGEITLPVLRRLPPGWDDRLRVAFGAVPDPDDDHHEESGEEAEIEGEHAGFQDWAVTADYTLFYAATSHQRYEIGAAGVWGKNLFERHTQLYSVRLGYLWRRDGTHVVPHVGETSEYFRWDTEFMLRNFQFITGGHEHGEEDAHAAEEHEEEEHHDHESGRTRRGSDMDFAASTTLSYGFAGGNFSTHLRGEYVSGVAEAGLEERFRVSPAVAWKPFAEGPLTVKLQYNYDHSPGFGDEHSVWLQFGISWGDCCAHAP